MHFAENICYFIGNKDIQIFIMNNNFQKDFNEKYDISWDSQ